MRDETRMLLESMNRLFEDHCTKDVLDRAETGTFPAALWQAVSETGVPLAALPEIGGRRRCRVVRSLRGVACRRSLRGADTIGGDDAGRVGGVDRGVAGERTADDGWAGARPTIA